MFVPVLAVSNLGTHRGRSLSWPPRSLIEIAILVVRVATVAIRNPPPQLASYPSMGDAGRDEVRTWRAPSLSRNNRSVAARSDRRCGGRTHPANLIGDYR